MVNMILTPPYQPFTLPNLFKGLFNGEIYCGVVDSTDPKNNQVQAYIEGEDGTLTEIPQPIKTNGGGFPVYNGEPSKIVVKTAFSIAVFDKVGNQIWYEPNMSFLDPRSTWENVIQSQDQIMGYVSKGDYASGITLSSSNEYVWYNGKRWFAVFYPITTTTSPPSLGDYTNVMIAKDDCNIESYFAVADFYLTTVTPIARAISTATGSDLDDLKNPNATDNTSIIQRLITLKNKVFIPSNARGFGASSIQLVGGTEIEGETKVSSKICGNTAGVQLINHKIWFHDNRVQNITLDGANNSTNCLHVSKSFRGKYEDLVCQNSVSDDIRFDDHVYFSSWKNIKTRRINIQPTNVDYSKHHAVVNDNTFENIALNGWSGVALNIYAAAGNSFKCINYEQATSASTLCLQIVHGSNNKFDTNWFEPGNLPLSMTHIVYINDDLAPYYSRNNKFENSYLVGFSDIKKLDNHVVLGACLNTSFDNNTFLRIGNSSAINNGSGANGTHIAPNNTFDMSTASAGAKILSGTNYQKQVLRTISARVVLNAGNDDATVTFPVKGTNLQYDSVVIEGLSVTEFKSISDQMNLIPYSYQHPDRLQIFHAGGAFAGNAEIRVSYTIKLCAG